MKKNLHPLFRLWKRSNRFISSLFWLDPCAGGVCIRKHGTTPEVLCVCHKNGKIMLPKGRCKAGETLEKAAVREFREETGIYDFKLGDIVGIVRDRKRRKKTTFFLIEKSGKQHTNFHDEATLWVKIEDALVDMRHKGERKLIKEYIENSK
ncbi:MAG: NUDIX domain-containing protein [Candidatus Gracilibacteria bacterium]